MAKPSPNNKKIISGNVPHFEPPTAAELQGIAESPVTNDENGEAQRLADDGNPTPPPPIVYPVEEKTVKLLLSVQESPGYIPRHVDLVMDQRHGKVVSLLRAGLFANHAQLRGGRHIENNADTLRWLLDNLADALEIE
jgi:hypothetical protein